MSSEFKTYTVRVSEKTTWIWFRLTSSDGYEGIGEATLNRQTEDVLAALPRCIAAISSCNQGRSAKLNAVGQVVPNVVGRVIASGLEQAWLDREAKRIARPVFDLLGGRYRTEVPCYANINRGTLSREPEEFADRAELAISDGYGTVKLAPFDDVMAEPTDEVWRARLVDIGLERVASVCQRVSGRARVNVDCHSRLRTAEAAEILRRLAALGVAWFEEPLLETETAMAEIAALRTQARSLGVTLAGAEKVSDIAAFEPFCRLGCYDVVMPDIVLAGGPGEVIRIGYLAAAFNQAISLHNPCGPVMDMHSAHVAAAVPELHSLERQFRESELFDELVFRNHTFSDGQIHLTDCSGLGLDVHWDHPAVSLFLTDEVEF